MSVVSYLDCGCAILSDSGREYCPTCAAKITASSEVISPRSAKLIKLIKEGKIQEAITETKNLSSEFDDASATYLVERLTELV